MFTSGQEARLWTPHLRNVFPQLPAGQVSSLRQNMYDEIEKIRAFRNRIAHHEPIFARNLGDEYLRILNFLKWRCPITADWVDRTQHVTQMLALRPRVRSDGVLFHYPIQ
jgi:hypothetical protein